ncbi:MAG: hypothetical protein QRY16_21410 [Enterobacterales bacterium endosymbiont of Blomia tropicalis]|uniref:hypothetical protein n=1 Tax=Mixta mediterraneensis TaxID=2758443 RepID=UPI0025A7B218|nr:hypothetical protein [Mixta mediterraneensis]MDL4916221.1 hypothetical protein [Mixta mediterraneensis]
MNKQKGQYTRCDALKPGLSAAAVASVAPMFISRPAQAADVTTLTVADVGGPYGSGFSKAFYKPFEEARGIKIINTVLGPDPVLQFQMMVDTKNYLFDVALLNPEHLVRLNKLGKPYLEEILRAR